MPHDLHEVTIKALEDAVLMSLNQIPSFVQLIKLAGSTTFNTQSASMVAASCICGPGAQPEGLLTCSYFLIFSSSRIIY